MVHYYLGFQNFTGFAPWPAVFKLQAILRECTGDMVDSYISTILGVNLQDGSEKTCFMDDRRPCYGTSSADTLKQSYT